ncbi:MAG: hypothetical protein EBR07_09075, partial [Planctomycetes bacterium]|nr:hypothetical protein [Planctomycetota bacterium]
MRSHTEREGGTLFNKDNAGALFASKPNATSAGGSAIAAAKALALEAHPRAALLFHWDEHPIGRQINIEGAVTHTSEAQSDAYWLTRRRENQISAWASAQSQPIANRAAMQQAQDAIE